MTNYEKSVEIYEKCGQYAIYDAVLNGVLQHTSWKKCEPCEDRTPFENNTCLVCGSEMLLSKR